MLSVRYVWLDGLGNLKSKLRTLSCSPSEDRVVIPSWNFDGSSTGQATAKISDVKLEPKFVVDDPFRLGGKMVLCDCYDVRNRPALFNHRAEAWNVWEKYRAHDPWFGFEQEYFVTCKDEPCLTRKHEGIHYCGTSTYGRSLAEAHYEACLRAGLCIYGMNAEVSPGQWEFQVGPMEGLGAADALWCARYILLHLADNMGYKICWNPKPYLKENGSGCHTNFSTVETRGPEGRIHFEAIMNVLASHHEEHLMVYGTNTARLCGGFETSDPKKFTWGISDRTASVRIPIHVHEARQGYLEDRRPASDCDPYLVMKILTESVCSYFATIQGLVPFSFGPTPMASIASSGKSIGIPEGTSSGYLKESIGIPEGTSSGYLKESIGIPEGISKEISSALPSRTLTGPPASGPVAVDIETEKEATLPPEREKSSS